MQLAEKLKIGLERVKIQQMIMEMKMTGTTISWWF